MATIRAVCSKFLPSVSCFSQTGAKFRSSYSTNQNPASCLLLSVTTDNQRSYWPVHIVHTSTFKFYCYLFYILMFTDSYFLYLLSEDPVIIKGCSIWYQTLMLVRKGNWFVFNLVCYRLQFRKPKRSKLDFRHSDLTRCEGQVLHPTPNPLISQLRDRLRVKILFEYSEKDNQLFHVDHW